MKIIIAAALTVVLVVSEVPSNSYLPPPPHRGYSRSTPATVIAARTLDQQGDRHNADQHAAGGVNGFARSGNHDESHDDAAHDHDGQTRSNSNEEQSYDQSSAGYARNALDDVNTTVSYEDTEEVSRSGYDSNSNNFRANNGYHGNDQDGGSANARSNGYN